VRQSQVASDSGSCRCLGGKWFCLGDSGVGL